MAVDVQTSPKPTGAALVDGVAVLALGPLGIKNSQLYRQGGR